MTLPAPVLLVSVFEKTYISCAVQADDHKNQPHPGDQLILFWLYWTVVTQYPGKGSFHFDNYYPRCNCGCHGSNGFGLDHQAAACARRTESTAKTCCRSEEIRAIAKGTCVLRLPDRTGQSLVVGGSLRVGAGTLKAKSKTICCSYGGLESLQGDQ